VYMVTNLQNGRTCFGSSNWTTEFCLVQPAHSDFRAMPCFQGVPVVISTGKMCWKLKVRAKLNLVS